MDQEFALSFLLQDVPCVVSSVITRIHGNMKAGTLTSTDDLIKKALRYRSYWGDEGGITVSGGEPLLQIDFLTELFKKAKENGNSYNTRYKW